MFLVYMTFMAFFTPMKSISVVSFGIDIDVFVLLELENMINNVFLLG